VLVPREQPAEGARYRIRAVMRYHGGIARFDNLVTFSHKAAEAQQDFGGRPLRDGHSSHIPLWLVVVAGAALAVLALVALLFLRRRRTAGPPAAWRALEAALAAAAADRQPLALVRIVDIYDGTPARKLARVVRSRLRLTDGLYRLSQSELLVILPATDGDAARVLYEDLKAYPSDVRVLEPNGLSAEIVLKRLREPRVAPDEIEVSPEMIQRWTSASKDGPLS
jgi:hypothetical protein